MGTRLLQRYLDGEKLLIQKFEERCNISSDMEFSYFKAERDLYWAQTVSMQDHQDEEFLWSYFWCYRLGNLYRNCFYCVKVW
jgi:hypothetical protein